MSFAQPPLPKSIFPQRICIFFLLFYDFGHPTLHYSLPSACLRFRIFSTSTTPIRRNSANPNPQTFATLWLRTLTPTHLETNNFYDKKLLQIFAATHPTPTMAALLAHPVLPALTRFRAARAAWAARAGLVWPELVCAGWSWSCMSWAILHWPARTHADSHTSQCLYCLRSYRCPHHSPFLHSSRPPRSTRPSNTSYQCAHRALVLLSFYYVLHQRLTIFRAPSSLCTPKSVTVNIKCNFTLLKHSPVDTTSHWKMHAFFITHCYSNCFVKNDFKKSCLKELSNFKIWFWVAFYSVLYCLQVLFWAPL